MFELVPDRPRAPAALEAELAANLEADRAPATRRAYAAAWLRWTAFADRHGYQMMPAEPFAVALFLSELAKTSSVATVRLVASAVAATHRDAGEAPPTGHEGVRRVLRGVANRRGDAPRQARPLDLAAYQMFAGWARSRGRRGHWDLAVVSLMRDAMLRRGEAAALTWEDIEEGPSGAGTVYIARSKTDRTGRGAFRFVAPATIDLLRGLDRLGPRVFGRTAGTLCRRIARGAVQAGLGSGYSGHSPRIGMTLDLVRAGVELPALQVEGRWKSPAMPAHYARAETALRGAVARWYEERDE